MKIIAFYLPQFHEIKENNKWWGDGFTEWTNVRKSKPLFDGHYQPREPLDDNYYDLSKVDNIKWQAELAEKYGVYGFCYYHYWFNGKLLLENPMEKMLEDKDISLPFCISWANEPWTRSWDGKHKEVLIDQVYGDEREWEEHFLYLLRFFKDDRYIKVDNKPVFLIYKSSDIKRCKDMIDYFNNRAKEHSFDGIYFVDTDRGLDKHDKNNNFSAQVEFEPTRTLYTNSIFSLWARRVYRYIIKIINASFNTEFLTNIPRATSNIYRKSIESKPKDNIHTIPGAFVSWDNSPRRKHESSIMKDFSIDDFEDYISLKILKGRDIYNSDFLFINAWNEWAEGTYLEPDKKYRFSYLKAVQSALTKCKIR
jgi:lipopolysaccharide biosynthesis protein